MSKPSLTRLARMGLALAFIMGAFQILNAGRAGLQPLSFADYMGLPVTSSDPGFVYVYGLRSLFIGGIVLWLVMTSKLRTLAVMASLAIILPLGDAFLTYQAGASASIVTRHLFIAVYLVVCAIILTLASRQTGRA
jgi:hypothetical protein